MSRQLQVDAALCCVGLSKRYGQQQVLDAIDLTLQPGEVLCVLGPNGAGKTTFIAAMLGLIAADSGQIQLLGQLQQGTARSQALRQQLGVMMQIGSLTANLTVAEQCDLFASYYPSGHTVTGLLSLAGLEAHANQRFGRLSGGQKQRLLFALALAGKPRLVFLDEPTLGMDVQARRALWQQIHHLKQQGVSVVLTTHYLEEAELLADRIAVLHQGKLIANNSPAQLKAQIAYKYIQCRTRLTPAQLNALPGVQTVMQATVKDSVQDNASQQPLMVLQSNQPELTLRALLAQDQQLVDLEVKSVALEQAFLQLTQTLATQEPAA
ncbi:ABC transporter [Arsukibacterium sp. MJ3]|uniref:ABC transporter ATP-binding protein n=1 Tax=Arsukibacterium sp. MJ3 TaxID=1632859 RepID=UPI0006271C4C|nr:ABC transporter ATP-binding protein [Arsukibacterium sp. MJ3]KKO49453.1 ABC transporter [Arsukibacterium sp. MJ3]